MPAENHPENLDPEKPGSNENQTVSETSGTAEDRIDPMKDPDQGVGEPNREGQHPLPDSMMAAGYADGDASQGVLGDEPSIEPVTVGSSTIDDIPAKGETCGDATCDVLTGNDAKNDERSDGGTMGDKAGGEASDGVGGPAMGDAPPSLLGLGHTDPAPSTSVSLPPGAPPIRLRVFGATDVGRERTNNEDNFLVCDLSAGSRELDDNLGTHVVGPRGTILAVADGMGGANAGEVASQMAVDLAFRNLCEYAQSARFSPGETPIEEMGQAFEEVISDANSRIRERGLREEGKRGMGSTFVAAAVLGRQVHILNVGDSRAYMVRGREVRQLSHDQSFIQHLLDAGAITPEQAAKSPRRNVVMEALGAREQVNVALGPTEQLQHGDVLIVCSDGLTGHVDGEDLLRVVYRCPDPKSACEALIAEANARGGKDNITVVVGMVEEIGGPTIIRPALDAPVVGTPAIETDASHVSTPPPETPLPTPRDEKSSFLTGAVAGMVLGGVLALLLLRSGDNGVPVVLHDQLRLELEDSQNLLAAKQQKLNDLQVQVADLAKELERREEESLAVRVEPVPSMTPDGVPGGVTLPDLTISSDPDLIEASPSSGPGPRPEPIEFTTEPESTPAPETGPIAPEATPAPETGPIVPEATPASETGPIAPEVTPAPETGPIAPEATPAPETPTTGLQVGPESEGSTTFPEAGAGSTGPNEGSGVLPKLNAPTVEPQGTPEPVGLTVQPGSEPGPGDLVTEPEATPETGTYPGEGPTGPDLQALETVSDSPKSESGIGRAIRVLTPAEVQGFEDVPAKYASLLDPIRSKVEAGQLSEALESLDDAVMRVSRTDRPSFSSLHSSILEVQADNMWGELAREFSEMSRPDQPAGLKSVRQIYSQALELVSSSRLAGKIAALDTAVLEAQAIFPSTPPSQILVQSTSGNFVAVPNPAGDLSPGNPSVLVLGRSYGPIPLVAGLKTVLTIGDDGTLRSRQFCVRRAP